MPMRDKSELIKCNLAVNLSLLVSDTFRFRATHLACLTSHCAFQSPTTTHAKAKKTILRGASSDVQGGR